MILMMNTDEQMNEYMNEINEWMNERMNILLQYFCIIYKVNLFVSESWNKNILMNKRNN